MSGDEKITVISDDSTGYEAVTIDHGDGTYSDVHVVEHESGETTILVSDTDENNNVTHTVIRS